MALGDVLHDEVNSSPAAPGPSRHHDDLMQTLAASVIATNDRMDSLASAIHSLNATSDTAAVHDVHAAVTDDDTDSVSTTATDDSIHALRRFYSSGKLSDFRFGRS